MNANANKPVVGGAKGRVANDAGTGARNSEAHSIQNKLKERIKIERAVSASPRELGAGDRFASLLYQKVRDEGIYFFIYYYNCVFSDDLWWDGGVSICLLIASVLITQ